MDQLPSDVLHRVASMLPLADCLRASSTCKRMRAEMLGGCSDPTLVHLPLGLSEGWSYSKREGFRAFLHRYPHTVAGVSATVRTPADVPYLDALYRGLAGPPRLSLVLPGGDCVAYLATTVLVRSFAFAPHVRTITVDYLRPTAGWQNVSGTWAVAAALLRSLASFPGLEHFVLRTSLGEPQPDGPGALPLRTPLPPSLRTFQFLVSGGSPLSVHIAQSLPDRLESLSLYQLTPLMVTALPRLGHLTQLSTGGRVDGVALRLLFDKTPALRVLDCSASGAGYHALHVTGHDALADVVPPPGLRRLVLSLPAWTAGDHAPLLDHDYEDVCLQFEAGDDFEVDTVAVDNLHRLRCHTCTVTAMGVNVMLGDLALWDGPISLSIRTDFTGSVVVQQPPPCMLIASTL